MFSLDRNYERNPSPIHLLDESIIQNQRVNILVDAIDKYLGWRQDKNRPDGRKFETTALTWLRHHSEFGENRARILKEKLLQQGEGAYPVMDILQLHFQTDSTLNNHSLDTWLLESILEHSCLFLVDESFQYLNTKEERETLRQFILEQHIQSEAETAFAIARLYEHFSPFNNLEEMEKLNLDEIAAALNYCLTNFNEPSAQKNQRKKLIMAVDNYLHWRDNKSEADERGYAPTALTWLRHATIFGEKRAKKLKQALTNTEYNPIHILQAHFENNSTLHNHSLDTYLLEMAVENARLFGIPNSFQNLSSEKKRSRLRVWVMQNKIRIDLPESGEILQSSMEPACLFYAYATELGHPSSLIALHSLAEAGYSSAQCTLGLYYRRENQFIKGTKWIIKAAEQNCQKAKDALYHTTCSAKHYLWLARKYEKGERVQPDYEMATQFYLKAAALGNNNVYYFLGQMYEPKLTTMNANFAEDANRAFEYYLLSAKTGNSNALQAMERIAAGHNHRRFSFQTGFVYLDTHANTEMALNWFKNSARIHFLDTIHELNTLRRSSPVHLFILGKLFEEKDVQKALDYYCKAIQQKDKSALQAMENLAECRDELRFLVAETCLRFFPGSNKALRSFKELAARKLPGSQEKLIALAQENPAWAISIARLYKGEESLESAFFYYLLGMNAARGEALHKLKQHLQILLEKIPADEEKWILTGKRFLEGKENIRQNFNAAKICFNLASQKGNAEANFYLGLIYQRGTVNQIKLFKAVICLSKASERGYIEAKALLTEILESERLTPDSLLGLGLIFENGQEGLAKNRELALQFYQKATSFKRSDAALHLGHFYQAEQDPAHAFEAFILAAKLQNSEALAPLEQIAEEASSENQLALSKIYAHFFHNQPKAQYWQERASETEQFNFKL